MRTFYINVMRQLYGYLISLPILAYLGIQQIFLTGLLLSVFFVFAYTIFDHIIYKRIGIYNVEFKEKHENKLTQ